MIPYFFFFLHCFAVNVGVCCFARKGTASLFGAIRREMISTETIMKLLKSRRYPVRVDA